MASITPPTSVTKDAASAMETLLKTSKYSDLTIRCREYVFKVHRSVICTRSKPLAAAIDGQFKESITGEIDLGEDEPHVVDRLIEFLYTADFDATTTAVTHASTSKRRATSTDSATPKKVTRSSIRTGGAHMTEPDESSQPQSIDNGGSAPEPDPPQNSTAVGPLVTIAKVYIIADAFDIQALKDLAAAKYGVIVVDSWNDPTFVESVRILYENTCEDDRSIKDIAIKTARINIKALLDRGEFRTLLKDIGEVAYDVLSSSIEKDSAEKKPTAAKCKSCGGKAYCPSHGSQHQFIPHTSWFCSISHCSYHFKRSAARDYFARCERCNSGDQLVPDTEQVD